MKTIEQKERITLEVSDQWQNNFFKIKQGGHFIVIENDSIPELIQALLPKNKAIIDVPEFERFEFEKVDHASQNDWYLSNGRLLDWNLQGQSSGVFLIYRKLPEPFKFPEYLPDGTELEISKKTGIWWITVPYIDKEGDKAYNDLSVDFWNKVICPNDKIEIPDWLDKEPRTIVKGE